MDLDERQNLLEALRRGTVTVTFRKVNSDEIRVMPCTLNENVLVANMATNSNVDLEENVTKELAPYLSVWALDSNGWRSFRLENVIGWEVYGE
jgi:hypothetical protein